MPHVLRHIGKKLLWYSLLLLLPGMAHATETHIRVLVPTTVPLLANRFEIDERIREITVLAFRSPEQTIALINPRGQRISPDDSAVMAMRWLTESGYDLVTIDDPEAGTWQIDAPLDPDNRVVVVTDLGLAMSPPANTVRSGENLSVEAWVTEQGQLLQNLDFLEVLTAKAQLTATTVNVQKQHQLVLEPTTSRFQGGFTTSELPVGTYQLDVHIDSGTFQRQIRRRFEVVGAPVIITYTPVMPTTRGEQARLIADLMINTDAISPSSLFGHLRLTDPDGHLAIAEIRAVRGGAHQLELPIIRPGHYQVSAHLSARDRHGDSVVFDMETEQLNLEFEPTQHNMTQRLDPNQAGDDKLPWLTILDNPTIRLQRSSMMNITILALIGWILAAEFALIACILFVMLQRAKHAVPHSPEPSNLMPADQMAERFNALEQQNTDVLNQLTRVRGIVQQLQPQESTPRRHDTAAADPGHTDRELPTASPRDNPHHDEEWEELIDLFDNEALTPTSQHARSRS